MGQWSHGPSIWCSKYYFFINPCKIICKKSFQFIFVFLYNFTKIKIKSFDDLSPRQHFQSIKIILGPSDTWWMIRSTQRPSVLYWRLSDFISAVDGSLESNQWLLARCLGLLSTGLPIQVNSFKNLISFEKYTYVLHYRANITDENILDHSY